MAAPVVNEAYLKEVDSARRHLRGLISSKQCAPLMLRLAWHDAGTYDAKTKTGGPNGSIRNKQEYEQAANRGLETAIKFCEEVKTKHPKITYADLYQLAGVVAVEVSGGPTIDFVPGRKDSMEPTQEGRLPDASKGADHLRQIFRRMGLSDRDIVALSGGHTLGKAHQDRSGFDGTWTENPLVFDNSYFVELQNKDKTKLFRLPTDEALMADPKFRDYVKIYAEDNEAFFRDYAESHKKLSELGFSSPAPRSVTVPDKKPATKENVNGLTRGAVGVAIAAAVMIFSYFFEIRRRSAK